MTIENYLSLFASSKIMLRCSWINQFIECWRREICYSMFTLPSTSHAFVRKELKDASYSCSEIIFIQRTTKHFITFTKSPKYILIKKMTYLLLHIVTLMMQLQPCLYSFVIWQSTLYFTLLLRLISYFGTWQICCVIFRWITISALLLSMFSFNSVRGNNFSLKKTCRRP